MNSQHAAINQKEYAFVFDATLLPGLKRGDQGAILKMGIEAFNADKLGYALSFFQVAKRKGHPDAPEFINLIREIVRKKQAF